MKVCKKCGRELDESQFSKSANTEDGLQKWCKECMSAYMKKRYNFGKCTHEGRGES